MKLQKRERDNEENTYLLILLLFCLKLCRICITTDAEIEDDGCGKIPNFSLSVEEYCERNISEHKKRDFVSPSGHVMFYLLY